MSKRIYDSASVLPIATRVAIVPRTDNQGDPCIWCQEEGQVNVTNVYARDEQTETCMNCLPKAVAYLGASTVEISSAATVAPF